MSLTFLQYIPNNYQSKFTPLHKTFTLKCQQMHWEDLQPGTLDHICSFDDLVRGLQILHNPNKKSMENSFNSKLLTVFPWSVHPRFMSKPNKLLSNYATQTRSSRTLQNTSTWTRAHPLIKQQNGAFHMKISIFWLDGPRVPCSQDPKAECAANKDSFFWALQTREIDMMTKNAVYCR